MAGIDLIGPKKICEFPWLRQPLHVNVEGGTLEDGHIWPSAGNLQRIWHCEHTGQGVFGHVVANPKVVLADDPHGAILSIGEVACGTHAHVYQFLSALFAAAVAQQRDFVELVQCNGDSTPSLARGAGDKAGLATRKARLVKLPSSLHDCGRCEVITMGDGHGAIVWQEWKQVPAAVVQELGLVQSAESKNAGAGLLGVLRGQDHVLP
mmetsp:Transcript_29160/g.52212  ORF Transcript_29160/g.52212 Transcript_29160/m.52212 type:complete len:208 (-) Transcript_29160:586-1209(-)